MANIGHNLPKTKKNLFGSAAFRKKCYVFVFQKTKNILFGSAAFWKKCYVKNWGPSGWGSVF
jgi:hypothetical protein